MHGFLRERPANASKMARRSARRLRLLQRGRFTLQRTRVTSRHLGDEEGIGSLTKEENRESYGARKRQSVEARRIRWKSPPGPAVYVGPCIVDLTN